MLPLTKLEPFYPGQWGIPGSDDPRGIRTLPGAMVYYVQSTHTNASNSNDGTNPDYPLATITQAVTNATAARGDIIMVGPGHTETWASAAASATLSKSGLTVVGVGSGQLRPRINYTHTASILTISAANVTIENLLFQVGVDSIVIMVDVNADDFTMKNCEFRENTAVAQQWLTCVDINGGGANAADRVKIQGCKFISEAAGANNAIEIGAVQDGIEITDNYITGDFAVAGIHSASACTSMNVSRNYIRNTNAGDFAIELSAAATGVCNDNRLYSDAVATCLDPGSLMCNGNLYTDAVDQSGVPIPATAAGPLPAGTIDAATFAAGAIDAAAIANGAIDAATFAAGAIDAAAIANGAIDQATFAADTILGADNGANAFTSVAVTADADGSIIERLEFLQGTALQPRCVEKANGEVLAGPDNLFTVAGGPVIVDAIFGLCATAPGGASNCHLDMAVTDPAATIAMSTDVAIDAIIAGGTISFTDVALPVLTITAAGSVVDPAANGHWYLTPGTIQAHCSIARAAAVIRWFCLYRPLSAASTVTAAA